MGLSNDLKPRKSSSTTSRCGPLGWEGENRRARPRALQVEVQLHRPAEHSSPSILVARCKRSENNGTLTE